MTNRIEAAAKAIREVSRRRQRYEISLSTAAEMARAALAAADQAEKEVMPDAGQLSDDKPPPAGAGEVEEIARAIADQFKTFCGGRGADLNNPIAEATKDRPLMFALGVDVAEIVRFVLGYRRDGGWQPIEIAPKDGTKIIVQGGIAYWRDRANGEHEAEPGWFTITAEAWPGKRIRWEVTHWQPLPAPPEQEP